MIRLVQIICFIVVNITLAQTTLKAKVIGIKDGDTVVVLDSLNNQTTLRLAEVDCSEKNQPFGTKAKQFTSAGMGWHYKRYSKSKELAVFEDKAKENKIGLWLDKKPIPPSAWRNKK